MMLSKVSNSVTRARSADEHHWYDKHFSTFALSVTTFLDCISLASIQIHNWLERWSCVVGRMLATVSRTSGNCSPEKPPVSDREGRGSKSGRVGHSWSGNQQQPGSAVAQQRGHFDPSPCLDTNILATVERNVLCYRFQLLT